jgi:protein TonB
LNAIAEPRPRPQPQPKVEKGPAPAAVPVVPAEPQAASEPLSQLPVSGSEDSSVPVPGASSLAELRQAYHSELMAHIEASKFYPDAARRRGVTGGVRVEFMVATGGAAVALECGRGPGILVQAACEAVRRAVPLPAPPSELHLPLPVSFVMDYSLK